MRELWNNKMEEKFNPVWINVLEKSMMEWFNKHSPGFMCVGRKPCRLVMIAIHFVAA